MRKGSGTGPAGRNGCLPRRRFFSAFAEVIARKSHAESDTGDKDVCTIPEGVAN